MVDHHDDPADQLQPHRMDPDPGSAGTPYVTALSALFSQMTGTPDIHADDNFFEVGGDSLAAVKLTSAINDVFGVPMKLRTLLRNPTVAALALEVSNLVRDRDSS